MFREGQRVPLSGSFPAPIWLTPSQSPRDASPHPCVPAAGRPGDNGNTRSACCTRERKSCTPLCPAHLRSPAWPIPEKCPSSHRTGFAAGSAGSRTYLADLRKTVHPQAPFPPDNHCGSLHTCCMGNVSFHSKCKVWEQRPDTVRQFKEPCQCGVPRIFQGAA